MTRLGCTIPLWWIGNWCMAKPACSDITIRPFKMFTNPGYYTQSPNSKGYGFFFKFFFLILNSTTRHQENTTLHKHCRKTTDKLILPFNDVCPALSPTINKASDTPISHRRPGFWLVVFTSLFSVVAVHKMVATSHWSRETTNSVENSWLPWYFFGG